MAAYFYRFILNKPKKVKKVRESASDGESLDLPSTVLPHTAPDSKLTPITTQY